MEDLVLLHEQSARHPVRVIVFPFRRKEYFRNAQIDFIAGYHFFRKQILVISELVDFQHKGLNQNFDQRNLML